MGGIGSLPLYVSATKPFGESAWTTRRPARFCWLSAGKTALAEVFASPYMRCIMQKMALVLPLLAFLAASVWFAYYVWAVDDGPPMPTAGYVAMGLGILFSLAVGIGLMALIFYSHRHGYDERGHGTGGDLD
jgi:hypothetical protein